MTSQSRAYEVTHALRDTTVVIVTGAREKFIFNSSDIESIHGHINTGSLWIAVTCPCHWYPLLEYTFSDNGYIWTGHEDFSSTRYQCDWIQWAFSMFEAPRDSGWVLSKFWLHISRNNISRPQMSDSHSVSKSVSQWGICIVLMIRKLYIRI